MESSIASAAIAAGAAICGGGIAAIASYVNTRYKLKELELVASQKLRENYLQNAREYTKGIYVPLALTVSRLYDAYNIFQGATSAVDRKDAFVSAVESCLAELRRLRDSGAEAFLTNELEDRLRHFSEFLNASLTASEVRRKVVVDYRVGFGGLSFVESSQLTISGKKAMWLRSPKVSVSLFGMGIAYEAEVVLSAPLDSLEFNKRFVALSSEIRILIKEVTLGGKPKEFAAK